MCTVETGEYFLTLDIILGEKVAWAFCGIKEEKQEEEQINEIYSELGGGIMVCSELILINLNLQILLYNLSFFHL